MQNAAKRTKQMNNTKKQKYNMRKKWAFEWTMLLQEYIFWDKQLKGTEISSSVKEF